jgi:hypothetical protein
MYEAGSFLVAGRSHPTEKSWEKKAEKEDVE